MIQKENLYIISSVFLHDIVAQSNFSTLKSAGRQRYILLQCHHCEDVEVRYYSLMAGPAWRLNEQFSLCALGGIGWGKVDYNQHYNTPVSSFSEGGSETESNFACGAGVQFNATENLVIDAGYQGGKIMDAKTNGFNVGFGYSF